MHSHTKCKHNYASSKTDENFDDLFEFPTISKEQNQAKETLKLAVNSEIKLNEANIAICESIREVRQINERAQGIAAASEEMVVSVQNISENAHTVAQESENTYKIAIESSDSANKAIESMDKITQVVNQVVSKVNNLAESSKQISKITGTIDDISRQTHLLALNASIEAARAGTVGRGFAVVADEVKKLSQETSEATNNIGELIAELQTGMENIVKSMAEEQAIVETGATHIKSTGENIQNMTSKVQNVNDRIIEVSKILEEQSKASNEVSEGIINIANATQDHSKHINTIVDKLDESDQFLIELMELMAKHEIPCYTSMRAKSDHMIWRTKLAQMLIGRNNLDPSSLADHHSCRLGHWYDENRNNRIAQTDAFKNIEIPHQLIHSLGIEASRVFQQGQLNKAIELLIQIEQPSHIVISLLDQLCQHIEAEYQVAD